ncbi:putative methyltransferase DDB_G0268948 isoform X2 [Acanthaster planci]|uniref:Methyltransferase DDB_G0268948 isoform X2 n=1 Tax=Acanthaster planci TaxID=133434 RepID=A0A8B7ZW33_ACAPL|nr:putative methyltransferase DDB_G0268948 isoform X2 [Acanthaster planci]
MSARLFEEADHAECYQKSRPDWPQEIIQTCLSFLREKRTGPFELAVDVACGSGQSTRPLAPHFAKVIGTDISEEQLGAAKRVSNPPNVEYSYHIIYPYWEGEDSMNQELEKLVREVFMNILVPHFNDRIHLALNNLTDIRIPYAENIRNEALEFRQESSVESYMGYLKSLSGYRAYRQKNPNLPDPLDTVQELLTVSGSKTRYQDPKLYMRSPVVVLLGRKLESKNVK